MILLLSRIQDPSSLFIITPTQTEINWANDRRAKIMIEPGFCPKINQNSKRSPKVNTALLMNLTEMQNIRRSKTNFIKLYHRSIVIL